MLTIPILLSNTPRFGPTPPLVEAVQAQEWAGFPSECLLLGQAESVRHALTLGPAEIAGTITPARALATPTPVPGDVTARYEKATLTISDRPYSVMMGAFNVLGSGSNYTRWEGTTDQYPFTVKTIFSDDLTRAVVPLVTLASPGQYRLRLEWPKDTLSIDGALYWVGWDRCEIKIGDEAETGTEIIGTSMGRGGLAFGDATGSVRDQYGVAMTFDTTHEYVYADTTFENDLELIEYRLRSPYGEYSNWMTLKVIPVGDLELVEDGIVNANISTPITSEIVNYRFEYTHPDTLETIVQDSASPELDISALLNTHDGETLDLHLEVTSAQGCIGQHDETITLEDPLILIGSFVDKSGDLFTAVNDGDNVQVSRFENSTASRVLLASIANAKNSSLVKLRGKIYCAYTDRADGAAKFRVSSDGGQTFSMPVTYWTSDYTATLSFTPLGVLISAGVLKTTQQIYFKRSEDGGLTWSTPVAIPSATGKIATVQQKFVAGKSTLIATNGVQLWKSTNGGLTWTAI